MNANKSIGTLLSSMHLFEVNGARFWSFKGGVVLQITRIIMLKLARLVIRKRDGDLWIWKRKDGNELIAV